MHEFYERALMLLESQCVHNYYYVYAIYACVIVHVYVLVFLSTLIFLTHAFT